MHRLDLVIFAFGNKCHWHRSDGVVASKGLFWLVGIIVMRYGFAFDYAAGFRVGFSSVN